MIGTAAGVTTGTTALNVDASASARLYHHRQRGRERAHRHQCQRYPERGRGRRYARWGRRHQSVRGGTGNDSYVVDALTDGVTEALSAGTDTVVASLNYTLGANVENLDADGECSQRHGQHVGQHPDRHQRQQRAHRAGGQRPRSLAARVQDTVTGGTENDRIEMLVTAGNVDIADGGAGLDTLALVGAVDGDGVVVVDLILADRPGHPPSARSIPIAGAEELRAPRCLGAGQFGAVTGSAGANLIIGSNGSRPAHRQCRQRHARWRGGRRHPERGHRQRCVPDRGCRRSWRGRGDRRRAGTDVIRFSGITLARP